MARGAHELLLRDSGAEGHFLSLEVSYAEQRGPSHGKVEALLQKARQRKGEAAAAGEAWGVDDRFSLAELGLNYVSALLSSGGEALAAVGLLRVALVDLPPRYRDVRQGTRNLISGLRSLARETGSVTAAREAYLDEAQGLGRSHMATSAGHAEHWSWGLGAGSRCRHHYDA